MANISKLTGDKAEATAPSMEDLELQIAELRKDIAALTKSFAAYGASKANDYKSEVDRMTSEAVNASMRALDAARAEATALENSFEEQVRARPLQAVGIAAVVGFLAAILTRRT